MICGIHQPNFLPWSGYFNKIENCDNFVFLDNVDIVKNTSKAITNRVKIKNSQGETWLTVPILKTESKKIHDILINDQIDWKSKHLKTIISNYGKSINKNKFWPVILDIYDFKSDHLSEFNINAIKIISDYLKVKKPIFKKSSDLKINTEDKNLRIIEICQTLNSNIYFSGKGAEKYMNLNAFKEKNIQVNFSNFKEKIYNQRFGEFIQGLSIIDYLFNNEL